MSSPTKKYKNLSGLFGFLSWAIIIIPTLIFIIIGFINGVVASKLILGITTIAALIILMVAALQKAKLRSPFWLVMIGLSFCLGEISGILILMGVCTVIDEMVVSPLHKHYSNLYTINREIDKRM